MVYRTGGTSNSNYYITSTSATTGTTTSTIDDCSLYEGGRKLLLIEVIPDSFTVNKPMTITMKDGSILKIDKELNFTINDSKARVIYKGNRIREFNKFLNASDLLEQFIKDMGELGAIQSNILQTPIEIFINWLILKASQQDGDVLENPPKLIQQPKCKLCGKFIPKKFIDAAFQFCNPQHAEKHFLQLTSGV
ncbi:MAG: hypothetical protein KJO64_07970 [Bacteroidia bacterium]|nr:hypothetical protein [Bacteroidia bacterium]